MRADLLLRDKYGKYLGKLDYLLHNEDECYLDQKVYDVKFPRHCEKIHGDVVVSYL